MSTPSARPSVPQAWVRGPKSAPPTGPDTRPATDGGTGGPAAGTDGRTPAPTEHATAPAPAGPAGNTRVAEGSGARPKRPAPRRTTPLRRPASSSGEPSWGEPRRAGAGRGKGRDAVAWVKAHGGAGATSLAGVLGGVEVGARWPDPSRGEPHRVVLVGRTSARGLRSVSRALGELRGEDGPRGLDLLAVVLVADAPGRLPLGLLGRIRVLRSVVHVHRVPWIPAWRMDRRPRTLPRQLVTLADLVGSEPYAEEAVS
ncbi:hypothetical protein ACFUV2_33320 [Streptomyces pilosus]|uniref:hypothetical protein n=1 Tax=Streptomyces pilosus TaxID=28893 RepID=UPI0016754F9A|nr:hypothetical protein [Streptomyces pilosus]GGV66634.1 hypothetical protein GCM10010261_58830 [Streptomyces pilosus]